MSTAVPFPTPHALRPATRFMRHNSSGWPGTGRSLASDQAAPTAATVMESLAVMTSSISP